MLYVGANDGMLHAFDEDAGTEAVGVHPELRLQLGADKGLLMLAKKEPFFKHQMFVDSTPVAVDVKVGGAWKTDADRRHAARAARATTRSTSPLRTASRRGRRRGERHVGVHRRRDGLHVRQAADREDVRGRLGGDPPVRAQQHGQGQALLRRAWPTASLLRTLETSAGSSGNPSGLAQVSGFVLDYKNQVLEQIYGGDLLGNVWRFDVSSSDRAPGRSRSSRN